MNLSNTQQIYVVAILFCLWTGICIFGTWMVTYDSASNERTGKVIADSEKTVAEIKAFLQSDSIEQSKNRHKFDSLVNRLDSTLHTLDSMDMVIEAKIDSAESNDTFTLPNLEDL